MKYYSQPTVPNCLFLNIFSYLKVPMPWWLSKTFLPETDQMSLTLLIIFTFHFILFCTTLSLNTFPPLCVTLVLYTVTHTYMYCHTHICTVTHSYMYCHTYMHYTLSQTHIYPKNCHMHICTTHYHKQIFVLQSVTYTYITTHCHTCIYM